MKIGNRKIIHNQPLDEESMERYEKFCLHLFDKLSRQQFVKHVKMKRSKQSEACYYRVYGYRGGRYEFSIRNHDSFSDRRQENIYLDDYETLRDLERWSIKVARNRIYKQEY